MLKDIGSRAFCVAVIIIVIWMFLNSCVPVKYSFDKIGDYNQGQFDEHRNEGFIKLNTPQSNDHNPLLDDPFASMKCPSGRYVKYCEWHCVDDLR